MEKFDLSIEYCVMWNYTPRALSLTGELVKLFTPSIRSLTLTPSSGGRFEVLAGGKVIFSKKAVGRHAEPGEVARLLQEKLGIRPMPLDE